MSITWSRDQLTGTYTSSDGRFTIRRRTRVMSGVRGSRAGSSSAYTTFDLYDGTEKVEHARKLAECKAAAESR
jgi:hypothetical protein